MFERLRDSFLNLIFSRLFVVFLMILLVGSGLIYRVFQLQIVRGQDYLDNFQLRIEKQRNIPSTRGNIYDVDGNLLAYNELAYSVTIEDVYESGANKNQKLNETISNVIDIVEKNGDKITTDFNIILDHHNNFQFTVADKQLLRFLADVYGHSSTKELGYKEKNATPDEVMEYLCGRKRFGIGENLIEGDNSSFEPMHGFTKAKALKILNVRYAMNANSFQKYIATTISKNVCKETVAEIMENSDVLHGVSIAEDTIRKYNNSHYFSQIIGYTGKVSQDELASLQEVEPTYDLNDTVGKSGIEASMETLLQGHKGSETVYVDNVGKVIETSDYVESTAGQNIYLTIRSDLQIAATNILEEKLASILLTKIRNIKEYNASEHSGSSDIVIPIYDVYYACIGNNVIDLSRLDSKDATETESAVYEVYKQKKSEVFEHLNEEFYSKHTPYQNLSTEYQVYESYIAQLLYNQNVLISDKVDRTDATYIAWTIDETISLYDYLYYAIAMGWVDVSKLHIESQYSDSAEIYSQIIEFVYNILDEDDDFAKKMYRYMIRNDELSGRQVCQLLIDQNQVHLTEDELANFENGRVSAYDFMIKRIEKLDITPAMLALDPCSGSIVVTDVNTGKVLALVSYPSYDNNLMANGVDAQYYAKLRSSLASPLINYATYQKTAPGSTYKMVSATAGLNEGVLTPNRTITCVGLFDKIDRPAKCWIYPGAHGAINVTGGIRHSCNWFFYETGFELSSVGESFNSEIGLEKLAKYADLYGLSEKSGIEIDEAEPEVSDLDPVRSAIGQGTNNFTTIGLARYVTAVANSGTCYNLTLLDKSTDAEGNLIKNYEAEVRNVIEQDPSYWNAIHTGMRGVVENKAYYNDIKIKVAGKTGTAQESTSRPNHALFVSYGPYEDPEISVTVRVANGYTSDYAAQIAREVYKYYYGLAETDDIVTGIAGGLEQGTINGD